ncbi:helix-turn-helix domain-containing protein [Labrys sp. LIt4]|uniref:helix-turn-helix domain-containing protein n=1 Tax=Labrys sp. LIt4 TaxID=2821355 RepID=UPI001AE0E323|nr:AraC family transcriptional regulator [Labrys sp. LIt4]MBP0581767.1 helix-turn-helix domain-containing protein [Labrys sp. LIt4]
MIFVPLPFVSALLFAILLVQMVRQGDRPWRDNAFFLLLLGFMALSVLLGLRWGYGIRTFIPLQTTLAALTPALAWLAFRGLTAEGPALRWAKVWPHLVPAGLVGLLFTISSVSIDLVVILAFLGYGLALTRLALAGPDVLIAPRLDGVLRSHRALQITAVACLLSGVMDIVISLDMRWMGGFMSEAMVSGGNVVVLLVLGAAAASAGSAAPVEEDEPSAVEPPTRPGSDEDRTVALALDALMAERQLYKDADLNLARLARRLNLPARRVSSAVNRVHGMSVSHYVNKYRIEEACHLLATTDSSVIQVMMEAGFLSKSNFNREFLRLTGVSPIAWRRGQRAAPSESAEAGKQKAPPWRGPKTQCDMMQRHLTQLKRNATQ